MIYALLFLILFAILFPGALRFLFALLFIGGIMVLGEVHAATCNRDVLKVHAAWFRGAAICNTDWLDRKASYMAAAGAQDCKSLPKLEYSAIVKQGILLFDKVVAEHGQEAACKIVDTQMTNVEK